MKLSDAKRKALVLMREWTNGGSVIPSADNADYIKGMDDLATIAQSEISLRQKIPATYTIPGNGTAYGKFLTYDMPTDFLSPNRVEYVEGDDIYDDAYWLYRWLERKLLGISSDAKGTFNVHYYKRPTQLIPDPANMSANDNYEFEVDAEAQELIPFFIAAQLMMDENPSLATLKLNEYQARLESLQTDDVTTKSVHNVLGW